MIRTVVNILKKHLDIGYASFEEMNDMLSELTSYDILLEQPDMFQLRRLARELISTMKDAETAKLIKIPTQEETVVFLQSFMPDGCSMTEDWLDDYARRMRLWLAGLGLCITEDFRTTIVRTVPRIRPVKRETAE